MINIDSLIQNQYQKYIIIYEEAKNNMAMILKRANTRIY